MGEPSEQISERIKQASSMSKCFSAPHASISISISLHRQKEEKPVFVQITLLQEKDFFGLNTSGEFLEEDNQDVIRGKARSMTR